jgi:3-oxoacyl-[acyl-carrier protein] reductase
MAETNTKKRLLGKVAVVTGAGRGMGRADAMLLARQGAKVVVNDLGCDVYGNGADPSIAQSVVDEIKAEGGEAVANSDTVATMEGAGRIINTAIEAFGRLDILINNAGILRGGAIYKMEEDDWDAMINTHLKGCFATIRHAALIFRQQRSGVIVNTSSQSGLGGSIQANYSAAKEGIVGLTRTVARELGRYNVRCNAIRPFAQTRMTTLPAVLEAMKFSEKELGIPALGNRKAPKLAGDISKPDQVAVMVVWLCTDAASHINGRTFQVGNGEIGLYSEPDIIRAVFERKGWDLDTLDSAPTRPYLTGDLSNMFLSPPASK